MDRPYFFTELREIFAIQGKNLTDGAVVSAVFRAVESCPNTFMDFAREKLADYTSLPSNLGRELRQELWPQFLEKYPQYATQGQQNHCQQCSADVAGFFWAQAPDGSRKMFKCVCNRDRQFDHMSGYTHAAVERQGYAIIRDQALYARHVLAGMPDSSVQAVKIAAVMGAFKAGERAQAHRLRHVPPAQ